MTNTVKIKGFRPNRALKPLLKEIENRIKEEKNVVLLVPEQYTLQGEKDIILNLNLEGLFNIEVLSPTRLAYRVLEKIASSESNLLDVSGQAMLITNLLYKYEKDLKYYKADMFKPGFVTSISNIIDNIIQAQVDIEELKKILLSSDNNILKLKWHDILLIYDEFIILTNSKFSAKENKLKFVAQNIGNSGYLKGKYVYVYGFDLITESLSSLLLGVSKSAESLELWLTFDSDKSTDAALYLPVRQSVFRLIDIFNLNNISYELNYHPEIELESHSAISHLDNVLYSNAKKGVNYKYEKEQYAIKIMNCTSPIEEAELVANKIKELVSKGKKYSEITIMLPNNSDYGFAVEAALISLNIPYFSNEELIAQQHPLISYIIDSVFTVSKDYSDEYMGYIISNPYCGLKTEERSYLKIYSKKYGIRKQKWLNKFEKGDEFERETAEKLRIKLINPLISLRNDLSKAKTSSESLTALYILLENINAYNEINFNESLLLSHGMNLRADQNQQLWNYIIDVFDQLSLILDGSRATFKKLPELLKQGFSAVSINSLPSNENMVALGKLGHMISGETKVLFIVGLDDSVITSKSEDIISEQEMLYIENKLGKEIGMSNETVNTLAKLDIKKALTLPKELLFLSYSKTDLSGKPLWPINIINDIQNRFFSNVDVVYDKLDKASNNFESIFATIVRELHKLTFVKSKEEYNNGLSNIAVQYNKIKYNPEIEELFDLYIKKVNSFSSLKNINKNITFSLYKGENLSVSRLESFAQCPFKHFINYGLKPQVIDDWGINPIIMGNFYHDVLDSFIKEINTLDNIGNIAEEDINLIINKIILDKNLNEIVSPINDGNRNKATFNKAKKALNFAAYTYIKQINASKFKIFETELEFGKNDKFPPIILELENGRSVNLRGKIDRVDIYKSEEGNYVRIIDYKSKGKSLSPSELWYGSQIQLTIYLDTVSKGIKQSIPAGAFYIPIDLPWLEFEDEDIDKLLDSKIKQYKFSGIILKNKEAIEAMDNMDSPVSLKAYIKKNSDFSSAEDMFTEEDLQLLVEHSKIKAIEFANMIYDGKVSVEPIMNERNLAPCEYCDFKRTCFNSPSNYKRLEKLDFMKLKEKLNNKKEG